MKENKIRISNFNNNICFIFYTKSSNCAPANKLMYLVTIGAWGLSNRLFYTLVPCLPFSHPNCCTNCTAHCFLLYFCWGSMRPLNSPWTTQRAPNPSLSLTSSMTSVLVECNVWIFIHWHVLSIRLIMV